MELTHKILESGYNQVVAVEYAHLFAQWPVGTDLTMEHVSQGEFKQSDETIDKFIKLAMESALTEKVE